MNIEEYKTLREEILQEFKWNVELQLFSVASTGALLSWVSTQSLKTPFSNGFLFGAIGLGFVYYTYHSYLNNMKRAHHRGGYLMVFHEMGKVGLRYHTYTRFFDELLGKKSKWGRGGRGGLILLSFLTIANFGGPLLLLGEDFSLSYLVTAERIIPLMFEVLFLILILLVAYDFAKLGGLMRKDLQQWFQIKEKLEQDRDYLKKTIKSALQSEVRV